MCGCVSFQWLQVVCEPALTVGFDRQPLLMFPVLCTYISAEHWQSFKAAYFVLAAVKACAQQNPPCKHIPVDPTLVAFHKVPGRKLHL